MTRPLRTQVAIIGAGPAGLLLSHLLDLAGISSILLERQTRAHVEGRIRAGVLEQHVREHLIDVGLGERLQREGLEHDGIRIHFSGDSRRIDFKALIGRAITVYGQHEVVRDLVAARLAAGGDLRFEASEVALHAIEGSTPKVTFSHEGGHHQIDCDFIAGCDGFRGVSRDAIPAKRIVKFETALQLGWLGILAKSKPPSEELIYASHDDGFALFSMRSPEISRLYFQCAPDEDIADWPDDAIWSALAKRLDSTEIELARGEILERNVTSMRSFVAEPMQFGRLFLAGDAAHIVPPTGAKGMNLAVADVRVLARGLERFYATGDEGGLKCYSQTCLKRVWKAQRFSRWMTGLLHKMPGISQLDRKLQLAELDYVTTSQSAASALAENYTGLPLEL